MDSNFEYLEEEKVKIEKISLKTIKTLTPKFEIEKEFVFRDNLVTY